MTKAAPAEQADPAGILNLVLNHSPLDETEKIRLNTDECPSLYEGATLASGEDDDPVRTRKTAVWAREDEDFLGQWTPHT